MHADLLDNSLYISENSMHGAALSRQPTCTWISILAYIENAYWCMIYKISLSTEDSKVLPLKNVFCRMIHKIYYYQLKRAGCCYIGLKTDMLSDMRPVYLSLR